MRRLVPLVLIAAFVVPAVVAGQQRPPKHLKLYPPDQLDALEVPDRDVWQRPDRVMDELNIAEGSVVADIGAASGWFTIRLASRVGPNGLVYAEDVQQLMLEVISRRLKRENIRNVKPTIGAIDDPRLPANTLDAALIVDSYHEMEQPVPLLRNLALALKPEGRIGIINFTSTGGGPGPPLEERVDPDRVIREAKAAGLQLIKRPDILQYQYMLVFGKPTPPAAGEQGKKPAAK